VSDSQLVVELQLERLPIYGTIWLENNRLNTSEKQPASEFPERRIVTLPACSLHWGTELPAVSPG
jgi:hypothetical protein